MALTVRKNQDWAEVNVTLNQPEATIEAPGSIQLATYDEVNIAEDSHKAITPNTLLKGKPGGVAHLDSSAKVSLANLPIVISNRRATPEDTPAIWFSV